MLLRPIEDRRVSHIDAPVIEIKALINRFGVFTTVDPFSPEVRHLTPDWLEIISIANPPTYEVDALRTLMLVDGTSKFRVGVDFAFPVSVAAVNDLRADAPAPALRYLKGRDTSLGGLRQKCASVDDDRRLPTGKLPRVIDDRALAKRAFLRCGSPSPQRSIRRKAAWSRARQLGGANAPLGQKL